MRRTLNRTAPVKALIPIIYLYFVVGNDAHNPTNIGMSDTSSNSSLPLISSGATASELPPKQNQQLNLDEQPHDIAQRSQHIDDEIPPLLPRSVSNQTGPNRPLPASPTRQQPSQR